MIAVRHIATVKDKGSTVLGLRSTKLHVYLKILLIARCVRIHHQDKLIKTAGGNNAFGMKILQKSINSSCWRNQQSSNVKSTVVEAS